MEEEDTPVEGQEPDTDEQENAEQVEAPEADDTEDGDEIPADIARKELKKARAEAAKYRTELRAAQDALSKAKSPEEYEAAAKDFGDKIFALEREVVAKEFNLPEALAKRLQGSTREELEADAKELAASVRPSTPQSRDPKGGLTPSDEGISQADIDAAIAAVSKRYKPL